MKCFRIVQYLYFLFAVTTAYSGETAGRWVHINPSLTSQSLFCTFFANPAEGWAAGRNGAIVHTSDSGSTWQIQQTPKKFYIQSLYFHDQNEGWAVGSYCLLYTSNGGKDWIARDTGIVSNVSCWKILFTTRKKGWLLLNGLKLFATEDGGSTWIDRSESIIALTFTDGDMAFVNENIGFIGGKDFWRTIDGGKTWLKADSFPVEITPIKKIEMVDTLTGYCLGWFGIAKTIDGGKTWKKQIQTATGGQRFETIHFYSSDTGIALFGGFSPMRLFKTVNGGADWVSSPMQGLQPIIMAMCYPEKQKGIAVAYNGAIFKIQGYGEAFSEVTKGTNNGMGCIDFCDSFHGLAATKKNNADSALFYTSDGGNTWHVKPGPLNSITTIFFFNTNSIVVIGPDTISGQNKSFLSSDGGLNWVATANFNNIRSVGKLPNEINSAFVLSSNEAQTANELVITVDAGKSWVERNSSIDSTYTVFFINKNTAWSTGPIIRSSSDGGKTWLPVATPDNPYALRDICFSSPFSGWVIGNKTTLPDDLVFIFHTEDAGKTWQQQTEIKYLPDFYTSIRGAPHELTEIFSLSNGNQAWILDEWAGVLHTNDGGYHWSQDTIPASPGMVFTGLYYCLESQCLWLTDNYSGVWKYEIPDNLSVHHQNFKNYAQPSIMVRICHNGIRIKCGSEEVVRIKIFCVSGSLMLNKYFSRNTIKGEAFLPFNNIPSGHYVGSITTINKNNFLEQSIFRFNVLN